MNDQTLHTNNTFQIGDPVQLPIQQLVQESFNRHPHQFLPDGSTGVNWIEQEYFHMDNIDEYGYKQKSFEKFDNLIERNLINRSKNGIYLQQEKEFNFNFNYSVFFEYAFYHTLFYLFLGPFCVPILVCWKGRHLVKNLHFHYLNYHYFQQVTFWLMYLIAIIFYFVQPKTGIYVTEIIVLCVSVILRIASICCKYATLPQSEIFLLLDKTFTLKETSKKQYVTAWQNQSNLIIYTQINNCMRRNEFDEQLFFVQFMQSPSAHILESLSSCNQIIQKVDNNQLESQTVSFLSLMMVDATNVSENHPIINCYGILKYLLDYYQQKYQGIRKSMITFTFLFSFIKCLIPIFFRYLDDLPILGYSQYDAVSILLIAILQFMYYSTFQAFIVYGMYDLHRLISLQVQMSYLIMPKKYHSRIDFNCIKHFPTLNIFNPLNMNAWMIMRKVSIEYGCEYFLRIQMLYSVTFVQILIYSFLAILEVLGMFRIDLIFGRIVLVELIQLGIEILIIIYLCAKINEFFLVHQGLLRENKEIIQDLYSLRKHYFQEEKINKSFVHRIGVDFINNLCHGDQTLIKNHLEQLIECYDDMILYLKTQSQTQPFTIVGIKIDFTFLNSILAGFISIIGSLVQLNSNKNLLK